MLFDPKRCEKKSKIGLMDLLVNGSATLIRSTPIFIWNFLSHRLENISTNLD